MFMVKNCMLSNFVIWAESFYMHHVASQTMWHHRLCNITWSDVTVHVTLGCFIKNHAKSSNVDLMISLWTNEIAFIYILYNKIFKDCRIELLPIWFDDFFSYRQGQYQCLERDQTHWWQRWRRNNMTQTRYSYSLCAKWSVKLCYRNEPRHDKTNKVTVRPVKTQISLGIRPVWSDTSLCTQWIAKDPSFLHADNEDSDQTGRMPRLIWVFAGRTATLLVLSCRGSNVPCVVLFQTHLFWVIF